MVRSSPQTVKILGSKPRDAQLYFTTCTESMSQLLRWKIGVQACHHPEMLKLIEISNNILVTLAPFIVRSVSHTDTDFHSIGVSGAS